MIQLANVDQSDENAAGTTRGPRRVGVDIRAGGLVTIMGTSGAGKSTLVATMGMLDVELADPASLTIAALLLLAVSLGACVGPAWRATRVQPAQALRWE